MAFPHTTEAARIQCGVFQPSTIANGASDSPLTAKGLRQGPADVHVDQSFSHLQHSLPKSENVSPYNFDTVNQSPGAGPSQPPPMSHKRSRTSGSLTRCSKRRKREDGSSMSFIEVEFTTEAVQMSKKPSKDKGKKLQPEVATIKAPSRHKSLILTTDMKTKAMDGFEGIVSVDTDGIQRYFCLKICPAKDGLPTSSIDGAHLDRHLNSLEHRKGLVKYGSATYTPPRLQYHCPISECTKRLSREDGWNDHFRKCHPDAGASPAELKKKCGGQFVSWDNRPEDKSFLSNLKKKARVLSLFKDYFRFVRPMNEADGLGDSLSPAFETTDSHSFSYLTPSDFEKSPMVPPPPPPNNSTPDSDFVRVADYEHDPISSSSSQFPGLYFAEEQDTSQYTFSGVGEPDDLLIPASSGVAWTGPFSSFAD
ncbi:hypothetical protein EW026_g2472 [Hermanssonia centrifuga]|uniref:C2H2-type domain-containing protein n=1 Tax=Hermanssonia centrifuga TaxID=98765 RepID=A0A4V3XAZ0_9APHY|nr:hypothetical protein EW026_g2472 [Hermanssonia centrifuga]